MSHRASQPKGWKPHTLKAPILGFFIIVSIVFIAILEYLSQRARRNGSGILVTAENAKALPASATFGFLYLPTILAVLYSMFWSWIDLDAKRLEPWFRLSQDNGAKAEDSVLLEYPFVFAPIAPFVALRRRHWTVFLAATVMLFSLWLITPMQSAIFNTATPVRTVETEMKTTGFLAPFEKQITLVNGTTYEEVYGATWLNQQTRAFTTPEYAILPFQPSIETANRIGEVWSADVQAFSTGLDCKAANNTGIRTAKANTTYEFDNGNGCTFSYSYLGWQFAGTYILEYIGYYRYAFDLRLETPIPGLTDGLGLEKSRGCSNVKNANTFFAISFKRSDLNEDTRAIKEFTALFCKPKYYVQTVTATVNATNRAILNQTSLTERTEVAAELFNTTHIARLISTSTPVDDNAFTSQDPEMVKLNFSTPVNSAAGFAVGLSQPSVQDLMQAEGLQRGLERSHQMIFSQALSFMSLPNLDGPAMRGVRRDTPHAVVLVRTFSIIVEVTLAIIVVMTLGLWYLTFKRSSKLPGDPSSISKMLSMVPYKGSSIGPFDGGAIPPKDLEKKLSGQRFKLAPVDGQIHLVHISSECQETGEYSSPAGSSNFGARNKLKPVKSAQLNIFFNILFIAFIAGLIATIIGLEKKSARENGLNLPSRNKIVLSLLENFLPTIFATLLEAIWLSMNHLLCLLRPFEELRVGSARYSRSVGATYTSLPPPLVIWRALKSHHLILVGVCLATISSNVLAVAFAGIFEERVVEMTFPSTFQQDYLPLYTGEVLEDRSDIGGRLDDNRAQYLAEAIFDRNAPLPAFVDQDYFYLPFDIPENLDNSSLTTSYRASTFGVGVDVSCSELQPEADHNGVHFSPTANGTLAEFWTSYVLPNSTKVLCTINGEQAYISDRNLMWLNQRSKVNYIDSGALALEIGMYMNAKDWDGYPQQNVSTFCNQQFVFGYVRGTAVVQNHTSQDIRLLQRPGSEKTTEGTFIGCTSKSRVAKFDVTVDRDGYVLGNKKLTDVEGSDKFFDAVKKESIDELLMLASTAPMRVNSIWHNGTTNDTMNRYLGTLMGDDTASHTDPASPPPPAAALIPALQQLWRLNFALELSINAKLFNHSAAPFPVTGAAVESETRLFLSPVMYKLALGILGFQLVMALLFFARRPQAYLPRLPTNIAATVAYFLASRAKEELADVRGGLASAKTYTYSYGEFKGTDGMNRVGVELHHYVFAPPGRMPGVRRRFNEVLGWSGERKKGEMALETREITNSADSTGRY